MEPQTVNVSVQVKTSPKDFFLHLLEMVALYASAISFLMIVFSMINFYVPDPLQQGDYYRNTSLREHIRGSLSALIVFFPVFLFVNNFLRKSYEIAPEKRNLSVRKWLIYFTLFVAALVMIGYLVSAIYSFLGGDLTLQFGLQVLSIFFVAGSIFSYYLNDVRKHNTE
ncbi:MAG: hypothetical protein HZA35_03900 [Parcubacteria group bacterium]|nr:hypothetical protein [Parcubacteria group bacterium]